MRRYLRAAYAAFPLTPAGRAVAVATAGSWTVGIALGWQEFTTLAASGLVALGVAFASTLIRVELSVDIAVEPERVAAGEPAVGRITVRNTRPHRTLPVRFECPVGDGTHSFRVPSLAADETHDELVLIETQRRGVKRVGPVRSTRGDPLGLARRDVAWTEERELIVHPTTIGVLGPASGLVRDLEGLTSDHRSQSDLAFHSLREYTPGDDRRHIHWKTTARQTNGSLMVREFVDTRRSQLGLVLSTTASDYASEDEFELAVSAVASFGVTAFRDNHTVTVVAGSRRLRSESRQTLLDELARVELADRADDVRQLALRAERLAPGASVAMLIAGGAVEPALLRAAVDLFATDAQAIVVRCDLASSPGFRSAGTRLLLDLTTLQDLPRLARTAATA